MSLNNIGQAGENDPLPGSLQSRIENAMNRVEMMEAEARRLEKLTIKERSSLESIQTERASIENTIKTLKIDVKALESDIADKSDDLKKIETDIAKGNDVLQDLNRESDRVAKETELTKMRLQAKEKSISDQDTDLSRRTEILVNKEVEHKMKVTRLLEALK